jgi:hypothetical protein
VTTVMTRVSEALRRRLSSRQLNQVNISFHLFPEEHDQGISAMPGPPALYPGLAARGPVGRQPF